VNALSREELLFGYWPARQMAGDIPPPVRFPADYASGSALNVACTQTALSKAKQDQLVDAWCELLPRLAVKTLAFSSKVPQRLFDAACAVPGLQALSVKWSGITALDAIARATSLRALFLGSSPGVGSVAPLSSLSCMEHLFIENVQEPVDLSFVTALPQLREFGLSAPRGRKLRVRNLEPLRDLAHLEVLWLVSLQVEQGGLAPLHGLHRLASLRTNLRASSPELQALRAALPGLRHLQAVG